MISATSATLAANVENLELTGSAAANAIGNTANNVLTGNAGVNVIRGGLGRDTMTGGAGRDTFDFDVATHSVTGAATRDIITDFQHLADRIDVSTIDASTKYSGNNTFTLLTKSGALFTGKGAELRFTSGSTTVIEGDVNGDKRADFQIALSDYVALSASDFVL